MHNLWILPRTVEASEQQSGGLLRWLLLGYVACLPIQVELPPPVLIRFGPSDLFLVAAVLLGIAQLRVRARAWSVWHVALLVTILFSTAAVAVTTGGLSTFALLNKTVGILVLFTLYLCVTSLPANWDILRGLLRAFAASVVVLNTVCVAAFLWCVYSGRSEQEGLLGILLSGNVDRLAGMLVNPNAYGSLLTVAYGILLLGLGPAPSSFWRGMRILGILSLSIGLVLTSSRSAWAGFFFLTLFASWRKPSMIWLVPVMVAAGVASIVYFAGSEFADDFTTRSLREHTIEARLAQNEEALRMFEEHPVFGSGIGTFRETYETGLPIHNTALWFLTELGLVGFGLFLGFAGWFCAAGFAAYRLADVRFKSLAAGLLGGHLAMIGFSIGCEAFYQRHWWLVMGLIALAYSAARQQAGASAGPERTPLGLAPSGVLAHEV